jgi:hypothetical protein
MIDRTNERIEKLKEDIERENSRRYAFQRMLRSTDRLLWRLEEMNRDGVDAVAPDLREDIKTTVADLPEDCQEVLRDSPTVQDLLDSMFEVQERLFRWRHPEFAFDEDDSDRERAS